MVCATALLHRTRRIAAKSIRLGRQVISDLKNPSEIERLVETLPVIEGAGPGLSSKVVVITGATQGVGLVVARAFGKRGARIVVNGRRSQAVDAAVKRLKDEEIDVAGVVADVSTPGGVRHLLSESITAFGTLDIVINNAAIAGPNSLAWQISADELEETVCMNLTGPMLCALEAIRWFVDQEKRGRIINVSSIVTEGDYPKFMPYSTTKAGLEAFTRHVASDLQAAEVIVTALILPSVQTERKFAVDWASAELLPPTESVLPAFEHCATGPAILLHGRTISAERFNKEPHAEARLASVASIRKQLLYPEIIIDGESVVRDPRKLTLLDRAENQHGVSPMALSAIKESLTSHPPAFYPNERYSELRSALAQEHDLQPENFALGPGSWELIARTVQLLAKPGEEVVSSGPGWFGFNLTCSRFGVTQRLVPFDRGDTGNQPSHNLEEMGRAITPRTRLVYLITPSNPEGVTLQHAEVREFLKDLPPELPVMIDEAYAEYANDPQAVNVAELVRDGSRSVIGLRTFSKFYGMAGLRVGYAYARPDLVELIRRSEQIFTVAHVAEIAAVTALSDTDHRKRVFEASLAAREAMQRQLSVMGVGHIASHAPYIFAQAPKNFEKMAEELLKDGIVVPRYRFHDERMVMLPVGSSEQNERVLKAIREHL